MPIKEFLKKTKISIFLRVNFLFLLCGMIIFKISLNYCKFQLYFFSKNKRKIEID